MSGVTRGYGLLEGFLAKQRKNRADRLIPNSYRKGRILDIGCGSFPLFLTTINFKEKMGLEKLVHKKECALDGNDSIKIINADLEQNPSIPLPDNSFDVITMLAVIEHIDISKIILLLTDLKRILKKDGILVITTPAKWTDKLLELMAHLRLVSPEEIHEHKDCFSHVMLRKLLEEARFERKKCHFGYFEFFMNLWVVAVK